jgi:hypothetical protein
MTPLAAALGIWLTAGGLSCLINAQLVRVVRKRAPHSEAARALDDIQARSGSRPLMMAALICVLLGPVGLAVTLYNLARLAHVALAAGVREGLAEVERLKALDRARDEERLGKRLHEVVERMRRSLFAECPECKRVFVLSTEHSLPQFPEHTALETGLRCPGSGKSTMGLKVTTGESLGITVGRS